MNLKLLFLLIVSANLYSQDFVSTYAMKCNLEEINTDVNANKVKNELLSVLETNSDDLEFNLTFSKNISIFSFNNKMKKNENSVNLSQINAENLGLFYTDINKGIILNQKTMYGQQFIVKENIKNINWILTNEHRKIGNYTCYKAIYRTKVYLRSESGKIEKQKNVTAWYSPQLPFSTGPKGYCGLPGLIVELYDDIFVYYLKKIDFSKNINIKMDCPSNGKLVSRIEFDNFYEKLHEKWEEENDPR
jgi:GLPGLI family protein